MNSNDIAWPPPFTIVKNSRSKRLSLRITRYKGLELIIPKHTSTQKALNFLNSKYQWVQKHLDLVIFKNEATLQLPKLIMLPTINETWKIIQSQTPSERKKLRESNATGCLYLNSNIEVTTAFELLRNWLKKKGNQHIPKLINCYSKKYQLPFGSLSIRLQKTRWGSCSTEKNISLNSKLLLLPPETTHYVIVHELVHTVHLNHSPNFWRMVKSFIPNYHQHLIELKKIEEQMPNWLYY